MDSTIDVTPDASQRIQVHLSPTMIPIKRIVTFVAAWLVGSILIIGSLVHPVVPGGWTTLLVFAVLAFSPVLLLLRRFSRESYPSAATRLLIFRPFWYLMICMPLLAGATTVGAIAGLITGTGRVAGYWTVAVTGLAMIVLGFAGFIGSKRIVVRTLVVRMRNLPEGFERTRVAQISDVHVGPHTSRRYLQRVVNAATSAQPDMIVFTGDQVDDFARDTEHFATAFANLSAPLGVFAIAGNHDVFAGWDAVHAGLSAMGITVLVNDAVQVTRNGDRMWVAGTGDPAGRMWNRGGGSKAAPDIPRTLERIPPDEPVIALAHNPALWHPLAARGVELTLSGHTHYGQLAIPRLKWNIASPFIHPSMGSHREGDSLLYINPGTNYWGLPFRIGTSPEVTLLVLTRAAAGESPSIDTSN